MKQKKLITTLYKASLCAIVFLSFCGCSKDNGQISEPLPTERCLLKIGTVGLTSASTAQTRANSYTLQSGDLGIYVKHPDGTNGWGKYVYISKAWEADKSAPIYIDRLGGSEMTIAFHPWRDDLASTNGVFTQTQFRIYPEENICYYNATKKLSLQSPISIDLSSIFSLWKIELSSDTEAHITSFRGNLGAEKYIFTPKLEGGNPDPDISGKPEGYGVWTRKTGTADELKYLLDVTVSAMDSPKQIINLLVPAFSGIASGAAEMWLTIDGRELKIPLNHSLTSLYRMNYATTINLTLKNEQLIATNVITADWPDPETDRNPITGTW